MLKQSQLDLCGRVDFTREVPLLRRDEGFSFACAGCGDCCRGREDIVLSGFDLWRIAARLRLPPRTVARAFCKASIGAVSHLPVLRLAPVREEGNNCPFLTHSRCAIHDAEPLVCGALPAGAGDHQRGERQLLFAADLLRRAGHLSQSGGLSGPVRHPGAGGYGCALGAGVHGAGRPGGGAGSGVRAGVYPADAAKTLASALLSVRLRRALSASVGRKSARIGRRTGKTVRTARAQERSFSRINRKK